MHQLAGNGASSFEFCFACFEVGYSLHNAQTLQLPAQLGRPVGATLDGHRWPGIDEQEITADEVQQTTDAVIERIDDIMEENYEELSKP